MNKLSYFFLLLTFYSLLPTGNCFAQNLVPNPSFEIYSPCPDNMDQVNRAVGWSSYNSTPQYYHACAGPSNNFIYVPTNHAGYQDAATGSAYCGFVISFNTQPFGHREAVGVQLLSDLIIGEKYLVSVKFCLANDSNPTRTACNNMGVKFSTVPYSLANPVPIDNISQVYSDSIISDTVRWTEVTGSFIADSAYQYICLGNFFDNAHTDTINLMAELPGVAYYYVDDVSVIKDTSVAVSEIKPENVEVFMYNNKIRLENINGSQIQLIDQNGKIVSDKFIKEVTYELSLENITTAIFYLLIFISGTLITYKFYKNQNH